MHTKTAYRRHFKQLRNALDEQERIQMDLAILQQFASSQWPKVNLVLTFQAMTKFNEPNIENLIKHLKEQYSDLIITTPVVSLEQQQFDAVVINEDSQYSLSPLSIPEPVNGAIIDPLQIDLIFIPLLAFDTNGYRLGYGKGMYDRFLERCKPNVLKIGISYFDPILKIPELHAHDVPLNYCITPQKVYKF